jgi:hypothetical protein
VIGDFGYNFGCSYKGIGNVNTLVDCDKLCRSSTNPTYDACVFGDEGTYNCFGITEFRARGCVGSKVRNKLKYRRWRLCGSSGALADTAAAKRRQSCCGWSGAHSTPSNKAMLARIVQHRACADFSHIHNKAHVQTVATFTTRCMCMHVLISLPFQQH